MEKYTKTIEFTMETERGRRPRQVWHAKRTGVSTSYKIGTD